VIRPVKRGAELLREIDETGAGRPTLWWLGQSGFAIKHRGIVLYIDPYLSESLTEKYRLTDRPHIRMTEAPLRGHEIAHADLVLATHGHSDHLDPGTAPAILAASPNSKLVLPRALASKAAGMGISLDRMLPVDDGERLDFRKGEDVCEIHVIPSAHEELNRTSEGGYPCLGYVLRFGDSAIYHPGDCVPYGGLVERLAPMGVTVALLPINGRDPKRGVPGNFDIEEAARLAEEIGARWIVPVHYDMFTFNTVDVGRFAEHMRSRHPGMDFRVLACGERWTPSEK
jgi:L-ascorbate metabolism protein UlaG (beta-lactamase superfamily)